MTLAEKVAQLGGVWASQLVEAGRFSAPAAVRRIPDGIGHVSRVSAQSGLPPERTAALANAVQRHLVEQTRLGIPAIIHEESTAGLCARGATQFPQAIGLAATWSPDLVEAAAAVIREQMLAVGARQTLAPVLDVARDPRWGRTEETYGEDPYLVSRVGVAYVRGLQSTSLSTGVAATGKHFLGYGLPEGGVNQGPVQLGPRELRDVYAAPFRAAITEASLASVMNSYSAVDGLPCGASPEILDDLLRGELGFEGVVVGDYFTPALLIASHGVASNGAEAAALALSAGMDVELPALQAYAALEGLVDRGELDLELVDRSVRRVLRLKFELGLFEQPYVDESRASAAFDTREHRALARTLAASSVVLLKNQGSLLPLSSTIAALAVVGPAAADPRLLLGDYNYPSHVELFAQRREGGESGAAPGREGFDLDLEPVPMVTILDGIRAAVSPATTVRHARGCDVTGGATDGVAEAVEAARRSDVAVVAVGGRSGLTAGCTTGEFRDASDLSLTGAQQQLVEAIVATGTPTVVVVVSGRVHTLPWIAEHVPAVLMAWVPGEEGGAGIADVLFGSASPAGRLPVSLPRSAGQVPVHYGYRAGGRLPLIHDGYVDGPFAPLFAFGHGLGYTTFEYAELEVAPAPPTTADPLAVSFLLTNSGGAPGEEVPQLYLRDVVASVARPVKQLAGFARVHLDPGQTRRVTFHVDPAQLGFHGRDLRYVVEPGEVRVMVGASSADIRLEASVTIGGSALELLASEASRCGPPAVVEAG